MLGIVVVVGLFSLGFAFQDPSNIASWATAFAMVCLAIVQVIRLRELNKHDT
jgi:hypothetical protein